jgi:hypothetical protein
MIIKCLGIFTYIVQIFFYLSTILRDPGLVTSIRSQGEYNEITTAANNNKRFCDKCKIVYDPLEEVVHCYYCNVCIKGF